MAQLKLTPPDDSWTAYGEAWPAPGEPVEGCYVGTGREAGQFAVVLVSLVRRTPHEHYDNLSTWANHRGEELAFNPQFWRSLHPDHPARR